MTAALELGTASIGNLFKVVSDEQAHAALEAAWDVGIRRFDTAPHYGLGLAERRLGAFLADKPRSAFSVSTKVGRLLEPQTPTGDDLANGFAVPDAYRRAWRFDADGVRASLEASLERLGLDHVDVAYLHDPDEAPTPLEDAVRSGLASLQRLRDDGVVDRIGVGSKSEPALATALEVGGLDVLMCSNRHTLVDRQAQERVLPRAVADGVDVVAVSVYSSGLLARPRPSADLHDEYGPVRPERLELATRLADLAEEYGVDLPTVALQFPARHAAVTAVAVGGGSAEHVRESARRWATTVPDALWAALEDVEVAS